MDDVWEYIDSLAEESQYNRDHEGNTSDIMSDIYHQLPFFCCKNMFIDRKKQEDINRYLYCKETGTQAFKGHYGDQPKIWKDLYFIMARAFQLRESIHRKAAEKKAKE